MGLRRVILCSVVTASMLVGAAGPAGSSPVRTRAAAAHFSFQGVACLSTNNCVAVGGATLSDGEQPPFIARWDGTRWAIEGSPTPTGGLWSVSCVSGSCFAVGVHNIAGGNATTLTERWTGSAWSIVPSPIAPNTTFDQLFSVTCLRPTECLAVGSASADDVDEPLVERWNGSRWSIDAAARPPRGSGLLSSVSCATTANCFAVGTQSGPNPRALREALIEHWNGTKWSVQNVASLTGSSQTYLDGVTCTSTASCIAVGAIGFSGHGVHSLVEHWNGASWVRQASVDDPNSNSGQLYAASCPTSTACMAVGFGFGYGITERLHSGSWQYEPSPQFHEVAFSGVTCLSATNCVAVGTFEASLNTRAEHWDGTRWTIQPSP